MGGRGGGSSRANNAAPAAATGVTEGSPEVEFEQWLKNPKPIQAFTFEASDGNDKVRLGLPDREALVAKEGNRFVVRDDTTDEVLLRASSRANVFRSMSRFYGMPIVHTDKNLNTTTHGSRAPNLRDTSAAALYRHRQRGG